MDLFFPEDHLNRMTPEETHITSLTAEPYPDGYRLRVNIEITPFQKRPHIEVVLSGADGEEDGGVDLGVAEGGAEGGRTGGEQEPEERPRHEEDQQRRRARHQEAGGDAPGAVPGSRARVSFVRHPRFTSPRGRRASPCNSASPCRTR